MAEPSLVPSWITGQGRTGGYYQDSEWYNLNIARRMPLVPRMIQELVFALPPLGEARVLDLLCGSGACSLALARAYPRCRLSSLDRSRFRLDQLELPCDELPGGPYDVIVATLAFHSLAGHQAQQEDVLKRKYTEMFVMVKNSLKPGGMLLYGDHVGSWGLYKQMRTLEEVGFTDLDVAWRQEAFFVAGGRKPESEISFESNK